MSSSEFLHTFPHPSSLRIYTPTLARHLQTRKLHNCSYEAKRSFCFRKKSCASLSPVRASRICRIGWSARDQISYCNVRVNLGEHVYALGFFWCIRMRSWHLSPWRLSMLAFESATPGMLFSSKKHSPAKSFFPMMSKSKMLKSMMESGCKHCSALTELQVEVFITKILITRGNWRGHNSQLKTLVEDGMKGFFPHVGLLLGAVGEHLSWQEFDLENCNRVLR